MDESEYLSIREIGDTGKTKIWAVYSKHSGMRLGKIKWFGRWRQYGLFPSNNTIWNSECLDFVNNFMREQMRLRRNGS